MAEKDEDLRSSRTIDFLLTQVGELKGTTSAMVTQLQSLQLALNRLSEENDRKHTDNLRALDSYKNENRNELNRINRLIYTAAGALAALELLAQFFFK